MSAETACGLCGASPARGFAKVGEVRYCHGDFDSDPTCYMQAQSALTYPHKYTVSVPDDILEWAKAESARTGENRASLVALWALAQPRPKGAHQ